MNHAQERLQHLTRLAKALRPHGLIARVEQPAGDPVLRLAIKNAGRVMYVACVHRDDTWTWVWTGNSAPITDADAPFRIASALRS